MECILSVKDSKAAMFYITDYITKMDAKTYEMLSHLSRAVSSMPDMSTTSPIENAKTLLHKCLAQFTRQQQIHIQQAARYIRRQGDSMSSHSTKPMMSAILVSNVKSIYMSSNSSAIESDIHNDNDNNDDDIEQISINLSLDDEGNLITTNQFHDYYYRGTSLTNMNFFDFCHSIKREKKADGPKNTPDTCSGVYRRHPLLQPHKLADSHHLVEYWNGETGDGSLEYPPRVIGCSIPCPNMGTTFAIFVLTHFKPFSITDPLLPKGETFDCLLKKYKFSDTARHVINNWDAINECEDARGC